MIPTSWGFVGGKVDEGEDHESALIRETLEETGLHIEIDKTRKPFIDKCDGFIAHYYVIRHKEHESIDESETGVIRLVNRLVLCMASPFAEYNEKAFDWFNL